MNLERWKQNLEVSLTQPAADIAAIFRVHHNGPYPSCLKPQFQSEAKCKAIDMKINFYTHANKTHFQQKDFAIGLVLKVRVFGTQELPIAFLFEFYHTRN